MGAKYLLPVLNGAGDEVRTRDILLGRQVLYQLSYTRFDELTTPFIQYKPAPIGSESDIASYHALVEGEGFEPSYSERTDLQSVAFNHSATPPNRTLNYVGFLDFCQTNEGLIERE